MKRQNRRRFIGSIARTSGSIVVAPYILNACKSKPANEKITLGMIGVGGHGVSWNMKAFLGFDDVKIVSVCDVDRGRMLEAKRIVDEKYGNQDCSTYDDFRDLLVRDDIDAVMISTPDHWHVPISVLAAQAGKDICCEKPTLTINEGRILCDTIKKHKRVFQTSIEDRAIPVYHRMAELVRNGYIGDLKRIIIKLPDSNILKMHPASTETQAVPDGFNYDMWLGPAPEAPYSPGRCHFNFRWIFDYSGGMLTDWGAHYVDTAQWANDCDHSGPVSVEGTGTFLEGGIYNTAEFFDINYQYANGVEMQVKSGGTAIGFEGSEGWIQCLGWRGDMTASSDKILNAELKSSDVRLYTAESEHRNFIDCIKSRKETYVSAETGHRTASALHMGNISMLLGRKLNWDPQKELFIDDEEANKMCTREGRAPWDLKSLLA
jgi:predicted dehydrogenase